LPWLILLATLGVGVVTAFLVVSGRWQIAVALILALPGLIFLHRHPFLAVVVWLVLGPFLLHTTTSAERQVYWIIHRALPPLTVALILLGAALETRPRRLPPLGLPELAMGAYLAFGVFSILLQGGTPQATLFHFYDRVFSPMCLYLIIRLTVPDKRQWHWLLPVFLLIVVSQSMIGVVSWVAPSVLPSKWLDKVGQRTTGTLVNPSIYTTALFLAGLLLLHGTLQMKRGFVRNGFVVVFALFVFGVFISLSRASWLAGIVVFLGLFIIYPRFMLRLSLVLLILGLILGSIFLPPYIERARERLYSDEAQGSALDRLPGYLAAYRMFQAKPLFGWGYGNFDVYDRQFMGRVLDFANDNKDHASHNWFLSILAEQGLGGMLLFFAPLLWCLAMSIRRWPQIPRGGVWNRKLLMLLWLIVFSEIIINMFMNMIIFFGHGMWWIVIGLMVNLLAQRGLPESSNVLQHLTTPIWRTTPFQPLGMSDVQ
jgi:O-antigen ligase